jgi:hypothetical protein
VSSYAQAWEEKKNKRLVQVTPNALRRRPDTKEEEEKKTWMLATNATC